MLLINNDLAYKWVGINSISDTISDTYLVRNKEKNI